MNGSQKFTVVGLGEVLWDVFPDGARFGGAPANVACGVAQLGGEKVAAAVASAVGQDDLGRDALAALNEKDVETAAVQIRPEPTGTVDVTIDREGHASYVFAADTAWDNVQWTAEFEGLAERADAVCFGTLAQRSTTSRDSIQRFIESMAPLSLRVFDVNLRQNFYDSEILQRGLQLANVVKLNEEELRVLARLLDLSGSTQTQLRELVRRCDLRLAALTCGSEGVLVVRDEETLRVPAVPTQVVDTVGAGDSFTAGLIVGLLQQMELEQVLLDASKVAAYVCSQPGATPRLPESLVAPFRRG